MVFTTNLSRQVSGRDFSSANVERITQIMLETLQRSAMYVATQAVASLHGSCHTTGIMANSGHDVF